MIWARSSELAIAAWLGMSPLIFGHPSGSWMRLDLGAATLVGLFALLSLWPPTRRAHLLTLAVAVALATHAWIADHAARGMLPAAQNHLAVAGLLLIFAVLPTEVLQPPRGWREPEDGGTA